MWDMNRLFLNNREGKRLAITIGNFNLKMKTLSEWERSNTQKEKKRKRQNKKIILASCTY